MRFNLLIFCALLLVACEPNPREVINNPVPVQSDTLRGMYILNEGCYNQNNASLDYLDFKTGIYTTDTFTHANPTLTLGLGDVGNDILVYGTKAYICVNGSGLIEVIDAHTAKHLAQIALSNCRRLCASEGKVYVTSYAGRMEDANHQLGFVAKIDTTSLTVLDSCEVGYQPEGLVAINGKLYVANSGGYVGMNTGTYDNRISVISLNTFTLDKNLTVAQNPQEILADSYGKLWISVSGNYNDVTANLYRLDPQTETLTAKGVPATKLAIAGDTLFFYATTYDAMWTPSTAFYKMDTQTSNLTTFTLSSSVTTPYGIAVNPQTHDLYVADAGDYTNPGHLRCYTTSGSYCWQVTTGVLPGHFAFVY